jgi:Flp pilus assembly protein TadD
MRTLIMIGAFGIGAFLFDWLVPGTFPGQLLLDLFLLVLFVILSMLPHELGHAVVARALGWRVYQIVIGVGKSLFKWRWFGILFDVRSIPLAGATWIAPKDTRWFRVKRFLSVLAGPAVNAGFVIAVVLIWQGSLSNFNLDALPTGPRLFLWANAGIVLINLWPHQPKTGFGLPSDGKQLLQLLSFRKKTIDQVHALRFTMEAMICRDQGNFAGARTCCDQGLALYPEDPQLLNLSGINHLDEQNYERGREVFRRLLAKERLPQATRFVLLNNLAYADVLSENPALLSEADACSRDALKALPWVAAVVGTRGTVLVALGRFEEGIRLLKKSMEDAEGPRNKGENSCQLAVAFARTGQREEARKYLELAKSLHPEYRLIERAERALQTAGAGNLPGCLSS